MPTKVFKKLMFSKYHLTFQIAQQQQLQRNAQNLYYQAAYGNQQQVDTFFRNLSYH